MAETRRRRVAFDAFIESYTQIEKGSRLPEQGSGHATGVLRTSRRTLETPCGHQSIESTFATCAPHDRSKGCLSTGPRSRWSSTAGSAQKSWRRLDGHNQLPKLVLGGTLQRRDRGHRKND